jgi:type I restriction enzyme S subunit
MIPQGWQLFKLGHILYLEYGKGLSNKQRKNGIYPVLGSNGVIGYHNQSLIKGPGIIIGRKGTIGAINWIDSDFWPIDTTFYVKIIANDVDLKWLFYSLNYLNLPKLSLSDVVPGLKRELVYALKLLRPPLPEQKRIAEVLATVDQAIEKVGKAIETTQRLKKGLMQELFAKGIGHKEYKKTEIGSFPRDWALQKLSELADIKGGKRLPKGHTLSDSKTPFPYIRIVDFKNMSIDMNNLKYLHPDTYRKIKRYTISSNDVYISIAGTVGISGLVPADLDGANLTENAAKLCNLRNVRKDFLTYALDSPIGKKQILSYLGKAQQPKLALFRIEKIKIPLPSMSEQEKIATILSSVDRRLEALRNKKEKLNKVKKGLMEDLLTGKVRVTKLIEKEA